MGRQQLEDASAAVPTLRGARALSDVRLKHFEAEFDA
ncbi:hypothetical protein C8D88_1286 [Lentzea atacamensis]|uniref:Uncharacterized protein n=1 Tax=Lentzea atacamensis TaxID=531938 RepID=A0A316HBQ9_9PSEU|nr:hypothetical protein C8D88_1286 [Lentzea atacamensis]